MNTIKKHECVLVAWIGNRDLISFHEWQEKNSVAGKTHKSLPNKSELGPIISSIVNSGQYTFDRIVLLDSKRTKATDPNPITCNINTSKYVEWAVFCISGYKVHMPAIEIKDCSLEDTADFLKINEYVEKIIEDLIYSDSSVVINFTTGTSHMAAVWLAIASRFHVTLIQTSEETGTKTIKLPFRLTGDFDFGKMSDDPESTLAGNHDKNSARAFDDIIYSCDAMKEVIYLAKKVARFLSNNIKDRNNGLSVLISGPTGSGKEGIAKGIHQLSGRKGDFVAVNCAAIPKDLFESEMFGFVKGAFTGANFDKIGRFEQADGGTLFLDEIGDIPLEQQTKLLRAIQERRITRTGSTEEKSIDVNIIAATHKNLGMMVEKKTFREDLFYRLTSVILEIPSLKARGKEDIRILLGYYLSQFNENYGASKSLSKEALEVFLNHSWPGNVRELQNTIIRAAIFSDEKNEISKEMAEASLIFRQSPKMNAEQTKEKPSNRFMPVEPDANGKVDVQSVLDEVEIAYINYALAKTEHNKSRAAKLLGYGNYQTLQNRKNKIANRKNPEQNE